MENDNKNANAGAGDPKKEAAKTVDILDEIGPTLTIQIATKVFGDNALAAMKTVAAIGGHGMFEPSELMHPLFGGLQIPDAKFAPKKPEKKDFTGLNGDYNFDIATKEHEQLVKATTENRANLKIALIELK